MGGFLMTGMSCGHRRNSCQYISRHSRPLTHPLCGGCDDHVRSDPVRHQPHHKWRRDKLYSGDSRFISEYF